jgi:hypothetical protein
MNSLVKLRAAVMVGAVVWSVVGSSVEAHAQVAAAEKAADAGDLDAGFAQEAQATMSGLFSSGNVSQLSGKAAGMYQLRYLRHQLRLEGGASVAGTAVDTDANPATGFETPLHKNLNQVLNARLRYDFFVTRNDTLYTALSPSHDSAQNLTARFRVEGGYKRYLFRTDTQTLGVETGLVYTLDYAPFDGDSNGDTLVKVTEDRSRFENTGGNVGGRLLLAYGLKLTDLVTVNQTVELIPNLFPEVEAPFETARVNASGDNKLGFLEATILTSNTNVTASLYKNLAVGMVLTFVYDAGAVARRNAYSNADLQVAGTLTYKFF